MKLFNIFKLNRSKYIFNCDSMSYRYDTLAEINSIPIPTEPFNLTCDFTQSVEYVLQRKATQHKRNNRMDLAIACLSKANQIMPFSPIDYQIKDYLRLVEYLKQIGDFERASIEKDKIEKMFGNTNISSTYNNIAMQRTERLSDNLICISRGFRICENCAKYHDRIYSISPKDTRFPNKDIYEQYISTKTCTCVLIPHPFTYGISIMRGNGENDPLSYSNRPFLDDRTPEEKEEYDNYIAAKETEHKNRTDYDWIRENLPDIAPKSFGGYMKMKNIKSKNYQKLIELATSKGYQI